MLQTDGLTTDDVLDVEKMTRDQLMAELTQNEIIYDRGALKAVLVAQVKVLRTTSQRHQTASTPHRHDVFRTPTARQVTHEESFSVRPRGSTTRRQSPEDDGVHLAFDVDRTLPTEPAFLLEYRWFLAHLAGIHYVLKEYHTKDKKLGGIIRSFACDYMLIDGDLNGIQKQEGDDVLSTITKLTTQAHATQNKRLRDTEDDKRPRQQQHTKPLTADRTQAPPTRPWQRLCEYCKKLNNHKTMYTHTEEDCEIKRRHTLHRRTEQPTEA
ncbi:unnamed protein product [Bodo saltans]|uniref:Uncharacterized protein n=1 Tax=Bodo saltans TaxID=75058 RepID=A0A0S4IPU8_BODSA|nr:unnamed protein product [Bodo saltans]|eukprot:CUE71778.1 unnamed protein product [Bodo saltans]